MRGPRERESDILCSEREHVRLYLPAVPPGNLPAGVAEIGIVLPNNQRQHHTVHIQKDVLPYALC